MGTRSSIGMLKPDGTVKAIYCHWDGYLDHNGRILRESYDTPEKVEKLLELGSISSLAASCDKPEGHSYDTPVPGHTVAYIRDRGEDAEENEASTYISVVEYKMDGTQAFTYLFKDGEWHYLVGNGFRKLPANIKRGM